MKLTLVRKCSGPRAFSEIKIRYGTPSGGKLSIETFISRFIMHAADAIHEIIDFAIHLLNHRSIEIMIKSRKLSKSQEKQSQSLRYTSTIHMIS